MEIVDLFTILAVLAIIGIVLVQAGRRHVAKQQTLIDEIRARIVSGFENNPKPICMNKMHASFVEDNPILSTPLGKHAFYLALDGLVKGTDFQDYRVSHQMAIDCQSESGESCACRTDPSPNARMVYCLKMNT